jgi:hypothetical protein
VLGRRGSGCSSPRRQNAEQVAGREPRSAILPRVLACERRGIGVECSSDICPLALLKHRSAEVAS